jgi:hypothetical protein
MPDNPPSQARLLAPIALAVCAIAFLVVVLSSGSGDAGKEQEGGPAATHERGHTKGHSMRKTFGSTYTVKSGDTLASIADKTGVPIDRLQELNPALDPQSLVSGQKIKLRE